MKYHNKTMPHRKVLFMNARLKGHESVLIDMHYSVESNENHTWVKQPIEISFCEMRALGGQLHTVLDDLEDQIKEARNHMQGTR